MGNYSEKIIFQSITHLMDLVDAIDRRYRHRKSEWDIPFGVFLIRSVELILLKFNSDVALLNCSIQSTCSFNFRLLEIHFDIGILESIFQDRNGIRFEYFMWNGNGNEANSDSIMHSVWIWKKGKTLPLVAIEKQIRNWVAKEMAGKSTFWTFNEPLKVA